MKFRTFALHSPSLDELLKHVAEEGRSADKFINECLIRGLIINYYETFSEEKKILLFRAIEEVEERRQREELKILFHQLIKDFRLANCNHRDAEYPTGSFAIGRAHFAGTGYCLDCKTKFSRDGHTISHEQPWNGKF